MELRLHVMDFIERNIPVWCNTNSTFAAQFSSEPDVLRNNDPEVYKNMTNEQVWCKFIQKQRCDGVYAEGLVTHLAASFLKKNIHVTTMTNTRESPWTNLESLCGNTDPPITLASSQGQGQGGEHFQVWPLPQFFCFLFCTIWPLVRETLFSSVPPNLLFYTDPWLYKVNRIELSLWPHLSVSSHYFREIQFSRHNPIPQQV